MVNIVTGAGDTGRAVVAHHDVDKVAFTGSTDVGRQIAKTVAGTRKKVTLELGGKAANIVFDDAPVDQAVEGIVNGIFFNQGHVCCAGSRLLVQESVADEVLERLKRRMSTLRVGDPLDKNTDIGAINSAEQLAKIRELSDIGEAEGAGRWSPACDLPEHGFWFPPTLFTGVTQAHRIAREEIFGPVLSVLTFRTPAEAVEKANNTPFGLSAGVWTDKGSRILWMADQLRAGVVWANTFNKFDPTSPFGGYKESGYGREGGRHGLEAYLAVTESRIDVAQDLQALRRRRVPPLGVRAVLRRQRREGQVPRQRRRASRKDARDAVLAARKAFGGWSGADAYNRGQVVYRIAEVLEGRRAQFVDEVQRSEGLGKRQGRDAVVDASVDRLVVRRLGRQDRPGRRRHQPGRRAVLQLLGARAHRRRRRPRPAAVLAARPGQRGRPGDRHRQHLRGRLLGRPSAAGDHPPRCWRPPTCRAAWSTCSPARSRTRRPRWRRTWTSTRST